MPVLRKQRPESYGELPPYSRMIETLALLHKNQEISIDTIVIHSHFKVLKV